MEKFNSLYSREMGNGEDDNLEVVVDLDQNVKKNENRFRFPYIRRLSSSITHCFADTDWKPAFYNIKTFCFDDVKIVDIEKNRFKRNILEMIHISLRDTVNLKTDTEGLNCIYDNLILRYKNKNREYG
ncbi:Protein of unknown function [Cotesia congregata]|uniref:Uncharacterized protein n=1 Tax=Cotesia congregata TaxID=51543 RepID=A0A8J2HAU9_COTCN|nr:Protein of unknown function [Cotesia congregata]